MGQTLSLAALFALVVAARWRLSRGCKKPGAGALLLAGGSR